MLPDAPGASGRFALKRFAEQGLHDLRGLVLRARDVRRQGVRELGRALEAVLGIQGQGSPQDLARGRGQFATRRPP